MNNTVSQLLKYAFAIMPMVTGLDKFTNLLGDWLCYLGAAITGLLLFDGRALMMIAGVIEIFPCLIALALLLSGNCLGILLEGC